MAFQCEFRRQDATCADGGCPKTGLPETNYGKLCCADCKSVGCPHRCEQSKVVVNA